MRYQVMPPLTDDEFAALKDDIADRGVLVPVEFDEDGHVLDGHHRLRACDELGITDYPKIVREGMTEDEKFMHAYTLNTARRHLTTEQKREAIRDMVSRFPSLSDRRIAKAMSASPSTVGKYRKEMEQSGQVSKLDTCEGADGKVYSKPEPKPKKEPKRQRYVLDLDSVTYEDVWDYGEKDQQLLLRAGAIYDMAAVMDHYIECANSDLSDVIEHYAVMHCLEPADDVKCMADILLDGLKFAIAKSILDMVPTINTYVEIADDDGARSDIEDIAESLKEMAPSVYKTDTPSVTTSAGVREVGA